MLTRNEVWYIKAQILHTDLYRKEYSQTLSSFLKKEDKIIDVACGTGFPSLDLYSLGYKNITCLDANKEALLEYKKDFDQRNLKTIVGMWQNLKQDVNETFDVLLCCDNSLVYLDSWSGDEGLANSKEEIFIRIQLVLQNFHSILNSGGKAVIALAKNIDRKNNQLQDSSDTIYKGYKVVVERKMELDWSRFIKTATNKIIVDGREDITVVYKSYLITKDDLIELMKKIGFKDIQVNSNGDGSYDDLIVGYKQK